MKVYSLTDYRVVVILPKKLSNIIGKNSFTLGGPQSYLESISIRNNEDAFSVKGDSTGSYVHTFNANRTGEVELSINQLATESMLLSKVFSAYFNKKIQDGIYHVLESIEMIRIINARTNEIVAEAKDSFIKKHTEKKFGNESQYETWTFVSGEVEFYSQSSR